MPNAIGYVDDTSQLAHYELLAFIKTFCEANGWTTNLYVTGSGTRELLMQAPGYVGPDGAVPAFVGFRAYHSVPSDYYNISVAGFTGYVPGNSFATQPGYYESGIPTHNQRIDYWMTINDRRLAFGLKVGTPVYEAGYVGYALPYATPRQFPYPLVVGGMLAGVPATRYSDTSHSFYPKGNRANLGLRWINGTWTTPHAHPWTNGYLAGGNGIRPSDGGATAYYPLPRVILHDAAANLYGELEGVHYMTGFNNVVENTLVIGGETYVVIQDVWRTGFVDYLALRLEP